VHFALQQSVQFENVPAPPNPERPPLAPHDPPDPGPQTAAWLRALRVVEGGYRTARGPRPTGRSRIADRPHQGRRRAKAGALSREVQYDGV
jgi:hypothetical protein